MTLITVPLLASLLVRDSYQFVFPDTFDSVGRLRERTEDNEVEPLIRSCPGGEDYCELPPSYPANKIARALHKIDNSLMRSLLNRTIDSAEIGAEISFRSRQSSESDYERVCSSSKEFIQPRQAKNKEGEYMFIVNGGAGLEETVQKVTVSRCLGAGHSCHLTAEETTECRQEHAEHRLVALDEAGQQLIMATFLFPSGCSCYKLNTFY